MCMTQYCICTPYITTSVICGNMSVKMLLSLLNCLKVKNNTWANFVNGQPKIKNYTDTNRILWHNKNAAWVFEWVCCFKNEQKSTAKRSNSPVWCQNEGKQHLWNGNLWSTSNHSEWRSQNVVQVCSKATNRNTEIKVLSVVSHFLAYVKINENFINLFKHGLWLRVQN